MSDLNDRMRQGVQQIQEMAARAEAEVVSEDGAVRVVAAPGGAMKELDLRMSAFQLSGVELGEAIVATYKQATSKVEQEIADEAARIMADAQNTEDR